MVTMTSRWSSRVTLTGAAAAGPPATSAPISNEASTGVLMTSFLPVFRISSCSISAAEELDRGGHAKFHGGPPPDGGPPRTGSAGDLQDDADACRELGRLVAGLPSTEPLELTDELRIDVARHHQHENLILARRAVRPIGLGA